MLRGKAAIPAQASKGLGLCKMAATPSVLDTIALTKPECSDTLLGAERPERGATAGQHSVVRRLRDHPHGDRLPDAIARLALIRDEVGVIAVLNFVPIGFDMSCH